jgi:DNA-binding response OmpR family regulator
LKTILIVEDEKINREILRGFIDQLGHHVIEAVDGKEALACIQKNPPDIMMPVIVTSALGEKSDVVKGIELGADDYLIKPFSSVILKARINSCPKKRSFSIRKKHCERNWIRVVKPRKKPNS